MNAGSHQAIGPTRSWRPRAALIATIMMVTSIVVMGRTQAASAVTSTVAAPAGAGLPPSNRSRLGGPLAYTGLQAWQLISLSCALLICGIALLLLLGRRRPQPGDVR